MIVFVLPVPGGCDNHHKSTERHRETRSYTLDQSESIVEHHCYSTDLRGIEIRQHRIALYDDWVYA